MDWIEIILRLGAASAAGAALGLNRDLHGKPTGVRTLGLVSLGSAMAVLAAVYIGDMSGPSRVMQGIVTGIGFLGAGVIMRMPTYHIHGLTTAACTWVAAVMGIVCGAGDWRVAIVGVVFMFVLLMFGGVFEHKMHALLHRPENKAEP